MRSIEDPCVSTTCLSVSYADTSRITHPQPDLEIGGSTVLSHAQPDHARRGRIHNSAAPMNLDLEAHTSEDLASISRTPEGLVLE